MDGDDRRAAQYGHPYPPAGSSRPPPGQPLGPPTTDRFAIPLTPVRSEPARQSITRPYLSSFSQYGYQEPQYGSSSMRDSSSMQGVELQYSPSYVQHVPRQQAVAPEQPGQQYAQYGPGTILPSMHQQTMYDHVPGYQQRQPSAIEAMSSQLGALPQYLPQPDQQNPLQLQTASSHYAVSQPDTSAYTPAAMQRAPLHEQQSQQQSSQQSAAEQEALQAGFREYEQQLRATFEAIIAGRLTEAGEKILPLSRWLTNSVVPLGLHHDDESQYAERMKVWRAFNLCWEALGQKQKDVCEDALRTGRMPGDMLAAGTIHRMVDELLSLCDQLEQYGLVDYEMGVAEEEITHIFTLCLDLLQRPEPVHLNLGGVRIGAGQISDEIADLIWRVADTRMREIDGFRGGVGRVCFVDFGDRDATGLARLTGGK
ncbi:hypothetical protein DV737_g324, partial [Chaetothyriales sp. CBS 132003]